MDPADEFAYIRGLEARLREAHRWHARSPSPPRGRGGPPASDTHQAKKTKTGQEGHQRAQVEPRRSTPTALSPPAATITTVSQHPNPAAQPATTAHTLPRQARTTKHAEPGVTAPPTPPPRPRPSHPYPPMPKNYGHPRQLHPHQPRHNRGPRATHPIRHTSLHHTITYTTTTSPYNRTRRRRGTTHNQHTLNTTTTGSSTTYRPH